MDSIFSKRDLKRFIEIIKIESIDRQSDCSVPAQFIFEDNGCANEHQFPGHPSRRGSKDSRVHGRGELNASLNPTPPVRLDSRAHANFDITKQQSYEENPVPIPADTRMEYSCGLLIHSHKIRLTVQADFTI